MVFIQFLYSGVRAELERSTTEVKREFRFERLIYSGSRAKGLKSVGWMLDFLLMWQISSALRPQLDFISS